MLHNKLPSAQATVRGCIVDVILIPFKCDLANQTHTLFYLHEVRGGMDYTQFLPAVAWYAFDYVLRGCARRVQPRSIRMAVPCSPQVKQFLLMGDRVPRVIYSRHCSSQRIALHLQIQRSVSLRLLVCHLHCTRIVRHTTTPEV